MRSAALRGKLPLTEDAFTASLVDIVRVHRATDIFIALLSRARVIDMDGRPSSKCLAEHLPHADTLEVELWPAWRSGEPDVVLGWNSTAGRVAVVIEVKVGATKSGSAVDQVLPRDALSGDQLADYLLDATHRHDHAGLIYLTHHSIAPYDELAESVCAARKQGVSSPVAWASWRDVDDVLQMMFEGLEPSPLQRDIEDALELLRRVPGLYRFRGRWPNGLGLHPVPPVRQTRLATTGGQRNPLFSGQWPDRAGLASPPPIRPALGAGQVSSPRRFILSGTLSPPRKRLFYNSRGAP